MKLIKNSSIRKRLTLIILSVSCISVIITTLAITAIGVYNLRESIKNELDISATIVGDRNKAILSFGTPEQARSNLSILGVKPPIVQACLYDSMGAPFANYTNEKYIGGVVCPKDFKNIGKHASEDRIEVMKIIEGNLGVTGYIYMESTLEQIDDYIQKQSWIAFTASLIALLVSYFLAINLQRNISHPILELSNVARQITNNKDYSIRAPQYGDTPTETNNELVVLTNSFNNMLTEISARDHQLKAQNTELERARDAAENANRAKSQFLANISHELRTPLNAIIGFSSIFMNQLFGALGDKKYLEYAVDINESGIHLLDIINDILDISKAEAGELALSFEEVHVAKSIQKCVTILAERAERGKVTVHTDIPKVLPALIADRLRFIQIVLNVLSNAIKFTEEGGNVFVSVETKSIAGSVEEFVIIVRDTGIGMTPEGLHKAFQSFGQVDSGLNRKYEGTGLGLPLTRQLLELHHGHINIESELHKGTTVYITFPAVPFKKGPNPV